MPEPVETADLIGWKAIRNYNVTVTHRKVGVPAVVDTLLESFSISPTSSPFLSLPSSLSHVDGQPLLRPDNLVQRDFNAITLGMNFKNPIHSRFSARSIKRTSVILGGPDESNLLSNAIGSSRVPRRIVIRVCHRGEADSPIVVQRAIKLSWNRVSSRSRSLRSSVEPGPGKGSALSLIVGLSRSHRLRVVHTLQPGVGQSLTTEEQK